MFCRSTYHSEDLISLHKKIIGVSLISNSIQMKKILLLVLFSTFFLGTQAQTSLTTAADFTATDIEGEIHTLNDYLADGQYVLIDFFAYWCSNCCNKTPAITEVYEKYGCNSGDLAVLTIEREGSLSQVQTFEQNCGGGIAPTFVGSEDGGSIQTLYGITSVPTFVLIHPDGTILNQQINSFSVATFDALAAQHGIAESNCAAASNPAAVFTMNPPYLDVVFTNSSTDAVSYLWDFGDGNTSTEENPSHTYSAAGTYLVCLTATAADGNESTECQEVDVFAEILAAVADFTFSVDLAEVTFTNSSANADSYSWDFGDSNSSTEENPTHTYEAGNSYEVCLTATNAAGSNVECKTVVIAISSIEDFISENIELYPNPTNAGSQISFELRNAQDINVKIFDVIGAEVAEIQTENYASGKHTLTLPIYHLQGGQYFISLVQANEVVKVLKLQKVD